MSLGAPKARAAALFFLVAFPLLAGPGCRNRQRTAQTETTLAPAPACVQPTELEAPRDPEPPTRPLRRCFEDMPPWADAAVALLLDRAGEHLERNDPDGALACAEEAARQAPRSVEAHHDRAVALIRLGRFEEARDALALALSIAPTDPETLELAADFYVNHLPPS